MRLLLEPIKTELKHSSDVHDWWLATQSPGCSFCDSPPTAVGTGSTVVMDECWLGGATALLEECLDGERGLVEGVITGMIQHGLIDTSPPQPEVSAYTDKQQHGNGLGCAGSGGGGSEAGDSERHGEAKDYSGRPSSSHSGTVSSHYYSSEWSGSELDTGSGSEWWSEESYSDSQRPSSNDDTADRAAGASPTVSHNPDGAGGGGSGRASSTEGGLYDTLGIMMGIERPPSLGPADSGSLTKATSSSATLTRERPQLHSRSDSRSPFHTQSRSRAGSAQEFNGDSMEQRESMEAFGFKPVGGTLDGGGGVLDASMHSVTAATSGEASFYPVKTPLVTSAFEEAEIAMRRKLESGQITETEFKVRTSAIAGSLVPPKIKV